MHRAVAAAEDSHAGALVVVLNASGGLDGSMRQGMQDLASSSVPTLAFVLPGHASAADSTLAHSSDVAGAAAMPNLDAFLRAGGSAEAQVGGELVYAEPTGG